MKLINLKNGKWVALESDAVTYGTLEHVTEVLTSPPHAMKPAEIALAAEVMKRYNHNVADFGMLGHFIYTDEREEYSAAA